MKIRGILNEMTGANKHALVISTVQCLPGILTGGYVAASAVGDGWGWLPIYAAAAAFISSYIFWFYFMEKPKRTSVAAGSLVGGISGAVAHFLCWYLFILVGNIEYYITGAWSSSLGDPPVSPLLGLQHALVLSFFSLFTLGWISVPIASIIGGGYAYYKKKTRFTPSIREP